MSIRSYATVALLSLFSFVSPRLSSAQDVEHLQKGVVKLTATTADGSRRIGTGAVVRLGLDVAAIVTASHVVEGARDVEVEFFTGRNRPRPAKVIGMEGGDPAGLAALSVEGRLPPDVSVLRMDPSLPVRATDAVTMIGFPQAGGPWAVSRGEIVGRRGKAITFSGAIDEGNSGGPMIKDGQVIGIVTEARSPFAYAVPAAIAEYVLESWGIRFRDRLRSQPARLTKAYVTKMIRDRGFSADGLVEYDGSDRGARSSLGALGNFRHEYEAKALDGENVIVDHATELMWQQPGSSEFMEWTAAKAYVAQLNSSRHAGFSDWRLPTLEELASLLEPVGSNLDLFVDPVFGPHGATRSGHEKATGHLQSWSADTAPGTWDFERQWAVNFEHAELRMLAIGRLISKAKVRAVRSIR